MSPLLTPTIDHVADYIITHKFLGPYGCTHLKLHKLLFYTQAWHLALYDRPLFDGAFEAWVHGPVNVHIFARFKDTHPLTPFAHLTHTDTVLKFAAESLTAFTRTHIDEVMEAYGSMSAIDLEGFTNSEAPWQEARGTLKPFERCYVQIREQTMKSFYAQQLFESEKSAK